MRGDDLNMYGLAGAELNGLRLNINAASSGFNFEILNTQTEKRLNDSVDEWERSWKQSSRETPAEQQTQPAQTTPGNFYYEYADAVVCVNNGAIISVATYTDKFQTERGIRQGDSLSAVLDAYDRVCSVTSFDDLTLYEYPFEMGHGDYAVVRFAVKNDSIKYISLRRVSGNEINEILSAKRSL